MEFVAVVIAVLALAFTIGSFWWLQARVGKLVATTPRTYAFADKVRLRLPLVLFNDGAVDLLVGDLRVVVVGEPGEEPLAWITTRTALRPGKEDGFAFATAFAVRGRGSRELIAEFGHENGWKPAAGSRHTMKLEARVHPSDAWVTVREFDWWAPHEADVMGAYIAHRNEPPSAEPASGRA